MSRSELSHTQSNLHSSIAIIKQCPVCNQSLTERMAVVIETNQSSSLIHVTCDDCKHGIVALVGNTPAGMGVIALVTDLSSEDVQRLHHKRELSDDDLLDFYQTIQKNSRELITQLSGCYELSTYRTKKRTKKRNPAS